MEHLNGHPHAFLDENNVVIDIKVFDEWAHDDVFLEEVKELINANQVVCCCTFGRAYRNGIWTGTEFRPPALYKSWIWSDTLKQWEPPIPMPQDGYYAWDEESKTWYMPLNPNNL